eukprot:2355448-Heterocapsa_arctica.AAC.1
MAGKANGGKDPVPGHDQQAKADRPPQKPPGAAMPRAAQETDHDRTMRELVSACAAEMEGQQQRIEMAQLEWGRLGALLEDPAAQADTVLRDLWHKASNDLYGQVA